MERERNGRRNEKGNDATILLSFIVSLSLSLSLSLFVFTFPHLRTKGTPFHLALLI
jgi:hypothetical protein